MAQAHVFDAPVTGVTEEDMEEARSYLGVPLRLEQYNTEASKDAIRHYAQGIGDENPLWCDESYAAAGPFAMLAAPPTFLYSVFSAGVTPGFAALQVFFGGGRWIWHQQVLRGDELRAEAKLVSMEEKSGRRVGRMIVQKGEVNYYRGNGELVAQYFSTALRVPRAGSSEGLTYEPRDPYRYSTEEYEKIQHAVLSHERRGAQPRYWEDVKVNDVLDPLAKGPLDLTTIITYYAGNLPYGYSAADIQWKHRDLAINQPELIPNNRSAKWVAETTWPGMGHYEADVARSVGMPGVYDNGWMRTSWLSQLVTDWMGDHGTLLSLEGKADRPNLMNDTTTVTGTVTGTRLSDDQQGLVEVNITGTNQLGEVNCTGSATVALPRRP